MHKWKWGIRVKEYYCKNGQRVLVRPNPADEESIIVRYRGREYVRSRSILGKTLFLTDPRKTAVGIGSKVTLRELSTDCRLTVFLDETHSEQRYSRMGGAYYASKSWMLDSSNAGNQLEDGTLIISACSLLGKAIMGRLVQETVTFTEPSGETVSYFIESIE